MTSHSAKYEHQVSLGRYLAHLWVLPIIIVLMLSMVLITKNPVIAHVSLWGIIVAPLVLIITFVVASIWVHRPIRLSTRGDNSLEQTMALLPARAIKSFTISGLICIFYILSAISISSIISQTTLSPRMLIALGLSVSFGLGLLIPTLAVSLTMAWMAKTRKKLSLQNLFIGNLEYFQSYPWLIRSPNRPWLIFGVTSLIPVTILGINTWLMFGTTNESEQQFILMQAITLVFDLIIAGIALVWVTSRTMHRVTRELTSGLDFLRNGKFDGHVAVMVDGEMGDLARGLNTALSGLKERDSLKDSLAIASDIQRGLMPRDEPVIHNYAVSGFQQSCYVVGGDYYDYIQRNNGTTWLIIADVSGKGYPAALTVANLQAMLHALAYVDNITLLDAATYSNRALHQSLQGGRFVTLFMAELNPLNHQLEWLNAGHIPPLLWQNNSITLLEAISPPLGMVTELPLRTETLTLANGDMLFTCTDGITEARNTKAELFGDQRVQEWFMENHVLHPSETSSSMLSYLDDHEFFMREDDITMLCLKRSDND